MRRIPFVVLAAGALLLSAPACSRAGADPVSADPGSVVRSGDVVFGTGTVRWFDFEGGFFAIAGDDGKTYDPIQLPAEFRANDLRVRFRARIRNDRVSAHMAGPIVEVLEVSRL
jgi:hypothetical protein